MALTQPSIIQGGQVSTLPKRSSNAQAWRSALYDELHTRPFPVLETPCRVSQVTVMRSPDAETRTRELDHLAQFFHMAVDFKKEIGFEGPFYIEPKPREPSTHQYDSDSAACLNFLREYDLIDHFKLNIETNHATLAGHTMQHELTVAMNADALGSIDANRGDELIGWDTDQFPTDIYQTTEIMLCVLKMGGFKTGGLNFDAKRRRESHEPMDLFHAHIGGMDAFARGLKIASAIRADGRLENFVKNRYSSFDSGIGAKIEAGTTSLKELEEYALNNPEPQIASGRQEMLENLVNEFI